MKLEKILKKLEIYTNIPRLAFEFETEEYIYMANTMDQINYILQNLSHIEAGKQNLKIYKDDKDTISDIKETLRFYEAEIDKSMETLKENYIEHCEKLGNISLLEEEDYEQ